MKKLSCLALSLVIAISLCACSVPSPVEPSTAPVQAQATFPPPIQDDPLWNPTPTPWTAPETAAPTPTPTPSPTPTPNPDAEIIVYVTRTGAKYHVDGCQYLRSSQIPITLEEAKLSYDPCSKCHPPR